jgi:hypothetical protein
MIPVELTPALYEPFVVDRLDAEMEQSLRDLDLKIAALVREAIDLVGLEGAKGRRPKT